jgi:hypothetical protein
MGDKIPSLFASLAIEFVGYPSEYSPHHHPLVMERSLVLEKAPIRRRSLFLKPFEPLHLLHQYEYEQFGFQLRCSSAFFLPEVLEDLVSLIKDLDITRGWVISLLTTALLRKPQHVKG